MERRGGEEAGAGATRIDELQALAPLLSWFEGGDRVQFGELCPSCPEGVRSRCAAWRKSTMDGLRSAGPGTLKECPYYIAWASRDPERAELTREELEEGAAHPAPCPVCGRPTMATVVRTASEFGTRLNPRLKLICSCPCGHHTVERMELRADSGRCALCGDAVERDREGAADGGAEGTVFGGVLYHIDCLLRLRFFMAMSELLGVAQGYMRTGRPLGLEEAAEALAKTLETVRAFRVTGNSNILGVNRVIHWLEGDSPLISRKTVLRTRRSLREHLEGAFTGESEGSVGVQMLEDAYIVYDRADEVRWITHGAYEPARGVEDLIKKYIEPAARGDWKELEPLLIREVPDGRCAVCGSMTRSHRVAAGDEGAPVYVCHHCWTAKPVK
ncbi:MAG: hypothetical protein ACUVV6_03430 [Thermoplasmatota archaeon]